MRRVLLAAVAAGLTGCQSVPEDAPRATASLQPTKGNKTFGEATFEQVGNKVHAVVYVQGLKPGSAHGLHIHEAGDCGSADSMSAKGHFNLPALQAAKNGRAKVDTELDIITIDSGTASIVGRAVHVHATDDYRTQPLACGVIQPG